MGDEFIQMEKNTADEQFRLANSKWSVRCNKNHSCSNNNDKNKNHEETKTEWKQQNNNNNKQTEQWLGKSQNKLYWKNNNITMSDRLADGWNKY